MTCPTLELQPILEADFANNPQALLHAIRTAQHNNVALMQWAKRLCEVCCADDGGAGGDSDAVTAHEGLPDPHPQYQVRAEKGVADGYASLDGAAKVPIAELPTGNTANDVCIGNDARLSDSRAPTGAAGGQLGGNYPNPDVRGLRETGGPTTLTMGAVADGEYLRRSGSDIIGDTPAGGGYTFVGTLGGDVTTAANTTPIDVTGLVFNYEANSTYRIWGMGRVDPAAATTGCGFHFNLSSAVTAISTSFYHQLANTGTLSGGHSIADDASVGVSSGLPGTSEYPVVFDALLVTTGNTGTAQLRFRSETTAAITCKAGFTLVVEKIA